MPCSLSCYHVRTMPCVLFHIVAIPKPNDMSPERREVRKPKCDASCWSATPVRRSFLCVIKDTIADPPPAPSLFLPLWSDCMESEQCRCGAKLNRSIAVKESRVNQRQGEGFERFETAKRYKGTFRSGSIRFSTSRLRVPREGAAL